MKNIKYYILAFFATALFTGCELEYEPNGSITLDRMLKDPNILEINTNGYYPMLKDALDFNGPANLNYSYLRQFFFMSEFESDNVTCGQTTTDPFIYSFLLDFSSGQENTSYFYFISYKMILQANSVIGWYENNQLPDTSAAKLQLVGENYFMRAFAHFNLVRFFAKPYSHDGGESEGVVIRRSANEEPNKAPSKVKEVYELVVSDLKKAASLMKTNTTRTNGNPSVYAANALLSRVYLYMENWQGAAEYASKVIDPGFFEIESNYPNYFANAITSKETIWCIQFNLSEDLQKFGSIGSMYYSNESGSGWGEEYASDPLRELLAKNPEDTRNSYIVPYIKNNDVVRRQGTGIKMYYVTKFSFQDGSPTLSSPVFLRISEVYLNRAEANAHLGKTQEALNDLDAIRAKRGLSAKLFNGAIPAGYSNALDVVLDERRMELCFEGHRNFDIFRNKQNMSRNYWGYHLKGLSEALVNYSTKPLSANPSWDEDINVKWNEYKYLYEKPIAVNN